MSVRRGATWLGAVCVLLPTAMSWGVAPALAEGESVRVRAPSSINAGGSPSSVPVDVSMRDGECVNVRTALGVRLLGLTADRVEVQVAADGDWRPVPVSDGADGLVVAERTAPDRAELCAGKSVSSRYRVSLLAGVPDGRVTVVAEAYTAAGRLLGRDADTARVGGQTGADPASSVSAPELVVPSETPEATEEAVAPTRGVAAVAPEQTPAAEESGGSLGIGGMVMTVGVVMVAIGVALIVLLIRRGRADRREPAGGLAVDTRSGRIPPPRTALYGGTVTGGADPTMMLPGGGRAVPMPSGADPTMMLPGGRDRTVPMPGGDRTAMMPSVADRTAMMPGGDRTVAMPGGREQNVAAPGGGDQTLILPGAGRTPSSPARPATPSSAQPASPGPGGQISPGASEPVPPGPAGSTPAGPPGPGSRPTEPVPPEQHPAVGPDATLILPHKPPPPR